jgi:hypothetical protein
MGRVKDPSRTPGSASRLRKGPFTRLLRRRTYRVMDAVAIVLALVAFALMFGLIRAMDRI